MAAWLGCSPGSGHRRGWARFWRTFTFGNVRQLDAVASRLLSNLATQTPILAGADQVIFVDIDDTVRETYGYAKPATGYGYCGVNGLNALVGAASTPVAAGGGHQLAAAPGCGQLR